MRIGILTLPLHTNYGGILQAYALQTILERMGNEVNIITMPYLLKEPSVWTYFKRYVRKYIRRIPTDIYEERKRNYISRTIRQNTQQFIERYIHQREYNRLLSVKEKDFDCIIVGSDQVWRYDFCGCFQGIENAYLSFAKSWNIRRISYAASFGLGEWNYSQDSTNRCMQLLKLFDAVSVREKDGVTLCREKMQTIAKHVIDPTLLLSKQDYLNLIHCRTLQESTGNLFYYILNPLCDINPLVDTLDKNLIPFTVNSKCEENNAKLEERIHPPIDKWLAAFEKANMVLTDSFHGCVFSIIFQKPFWVIENESGGNSRIYSLLETFHLTDRLIKFPIDISIFKKQDINWEVINNILLSKQEDSCKFLRDSLAYA